MPGNGLNLVYVHGFLTHLLQILWLITAQTSLNKIRKGGSRFLPVLATNINEVAVFHALVPCFGR